MPRNNSLVAGLVLAVLLALPAAAQQGPQLLGEHGAWTAATHQEGGQKVCYAFARAARSQGAPASRGAVTLTVAHRPNGRDQVALSAGYPLGRAAQSVLAVGEQEFRSYGVVRTSAFFDSSRELIAAFRRGRDAVARTPAPTGGGAVTDTFSLSGFTAAYEAIGRACPARAAR
ncbi:invasion associated locus B family protein [Falsiroseomonas sp.]|uniref:invasion associated locus B family protein n=1 Tax=Falsiroseomonas sp. TaxID=2870721 RepID=UPI003567F71A